MSPIHTALRTGGLALSLAASLLAPPALAQPADSVAAAPTGALASRTVSGDERLLLTLGGVGGSAALMYGTGALTENGIAVLVALPVGAGLGVAVSGHLLEVEGSTGRAFWGAAVGTGVGAIAAVAVGGLVIAVLPPGECSFICEDAAIGLLAGMAVGAVMPSVFAARLYPSARVVPSVTPVPSATDPGQAAAGLTLRIGL